LEYGINNRVGKPSEYNAHRIIDYAYKNGVNSLDTAAAYGSSESIVGKFIRNSEADPEIKVSTKISDFSYENAMNSFYRLGKKIDYLLFHELDNLIRNSATVSPIVEKLKKDSIIDKIGVSIYSPEDMMSACNYLDIDIIQAPFNVFDARIMKPDYLSIMKKSHIELHTRSVFLQGLLLMEVSEIPGYLHDSCKYIDKYNELCNETGYTQAQLAFLYVRDNNALSHFFVGCETLEQLHENLEINKMPHLANAIICEIEGLFNDLPESIINPSLWRR